MEEKKRTKLAAKPQKNHANFALKNLLHSPKLEELQKEISVNNGPAVE